MTLTNVQIAKAMQLLGLTQSDFRAIEQAPSLEAGQRMLVEFKERVKKQFRKCALELHPDRTGNDLAKTDDFKLVSAVVDDIERLMFSPRPPPRPMPQPMTVRIVFVSTGGFGYSSTASTTTTGNGWGF